MSGEIDLERTDSIVPPTSSASENKIEGQEKVEQLRQLLQELGESFKVRPLILGPGVTPELLDAAIAARGGDDLSVNERFQTIDGAREKAYKIMVLSGDQETYEDLRGKALEFAMEDNYGIERTSGISPADETMLQELEKRLIERSDKTGVYERHGVTFVARANLTEDGSVVINTVVLEVADNELNVRTEMTQLQKEAGLVGDSASQNS